MSTSGNHLEARCPDRSRRKSPVDGVVVKLFAGALLFAVVGCSLAPETATPRLEPVADGPVWPAPPDLARYAYVGTLIGERNFLAPGGADDGAFTTALKWIVGLVFDDPNYLELQRPVGGMVDERGSIYVVDAGHKAVIVFDMAGQRVLRWRQAAPGEAFVSPVAIVGDGAAGFLVTDSERKEIIRLDAEGEPVGRFGKGVLGRPTGIARDARTGVIYVADTTAHDIKIFNDRGEIVDRLGARGVEPGTFNYPTYLAFRHDQLYVADTLNFRVQVFNREGDGRLIFGKLGLFVGNMTRPKGVAVGDDGRIYVVESYFDHLLVYDRGGDFLLPIGGTGQGIGQFYLPAGAWTDPLGRVYIADTFNGRIVVFKELA
jgi:DNA-binding beta-propeller fold protein YncE